MHACAQKRESLRAAGCGEMQSFFLFLLLSKSPIMSNYYVNNQKGAIFQTWFWQANQSLRQFLKADC